MPQRKNPYSTLRTQPVQQEQEKQEQEEEKK